MRNYPEIFTHWIPKQRLLWVFVKLFVQKTLFMEHITGSWSNEHSFGKCGFVSSFSLLLEPARVHISPGVPWIICSGPVIFKFFFSQFSWSHKSL